jgi:hypothetical protein
MIPELHLAVVVCCACAICAGLETERDDLGFTFVMTFKSIFCEIYGST